MESKTPRTDTFSRIIYGMTEFVESKLARQLENELAEARAEIERKYKLIEQMREALKSIDGIGREAGAARREDALRCFAIAAAALAAERGE